MSQLPKRESKLPERFQAWKPGDEHAPYSIRNFKKKDKVKVKKYQASYREKKKDNSGNKEPSDKNVKIINEKKGKKAKKNGKAAKKKETNGSEKILELAEKKEKYKEYQRIYREKANEKKEKEKKKNKKYQEQYRATKGNRKSAC